MRDVKLARQSARRTGIDARHSKNPSMAKLPGEQHANTKIHHTKLSKQITDYNGSNGPGGIELVNSMLWAQHSGITSKVTDPMVEQRYGRTHHSGDITQLLVLTNKWTGGMADKTISYGAHNGFDFWMGVHHQQLPGVADQKQLPMQDSNNPKSATDVNEQRGRIQDMERNTSVFTNLADSNLDGAKG